MFFDPYAYEVSKVFNSINKYPALAPSPEGTPADSRFKQWQKGLHLKLAIIDLAVVGILKNIVLDAINLLETFIVGVISLDIEEYQQLKVIGYESARKITLFVRLLFLAAWNTQKKFESLQKEVRDSDSESWLRYDKLNSYHSYLDDNYTYTLAYNDTRVFEKDWKNPTLVHKKEFRLVSKYLAIPIRGLCGTIQLIAYSIFSLLEAPFLRDHESKWTKPIGILFLTTPSYLLITTIGALFIKSCRNTLGIDLD